jgi:Mn-dependent DtxR family transcriptional regulator
MESASNDNGISTLIESVLKVKKAKSKCLKGSSKNEQVAVVLEVSPASASRMLMCS